MTSHPSRLGLAALLLGAAAIGFAPILVRLSEVGPVATAFHRMALSLPFFAVMAFRNHAAMPLGRKEWLGLVLVGLFFACDLSIWHISIGLTTVANATLFANVAPVFVALGLWAVYGQKPSRGFAIALAVAMVGASLLMGGSFSLSVEHLAGDALALLAASFYGGYIIAVGRLRMRLSAALLLLLSGLVTAVAVLPVALLLGEQVLPSSLQGWAVVVALALVTQVAGQGLIAYGLAHLPAAFGAVVLLVQPVVAAAVAWALFGEALGPMELAGAVVVLCGIYLARKANTPA